MPRAAGRLMAAGLLDGALIVAAMIPAAVLPGRAIAQAPDAAEVLVTVGAERISRADLAEALGRLGAAGLPDGAAKTRATTLAIGQLVEERLLRGEIARQGIRATDSEIDRAVAQLVAQGQRRDTSADPRLRRQLELELCLKKLLLPQLDEEALARTFAKHRRELDGTRLRLSHIVLRPDPGRGDDAVPLAVRRAGEIRGRIVDGSMTFAEAAARFSAGPSRHRGGDLGFTGRSGLHHEAVAAAAFALADGEVSAPVTTPFGVHLVTVTASEPGSGDMRALRPKLEQVWARQAVAELVGRLRRETPVTYAPGVPEPHHPDDSPAAGAAPAAPD